MVCEDFDHFKDVYVRVLGEDSGLADMIKEDDVLEETTVRADVAASLRNKESPTAIRESEVAPVPRKGFAKFFHFGPKIEN